MEDNRSEEELFAAVMANTDMLSDEEKAEVEVPPMEDVEEDIVEDQEELEEDLEEAEEEIEEDEEVDEEEVEEEEEEEAEETEADLPEEDEVDWDYKIPVKVDGETQYLTLEEVRKGYATQEHLNNAGREVGEARKQIEEYRAQRLGEVEQMAEGVSAMLGSQEQYAAQQYHAIDQEIAKAREEGDTYKVQELKDQREVAQQQYWGIRNQREQVLGQVAQYKQQAEVEEWNQKVQGFYEGIVEVIPDYNEEYANSIREFALSEGVSEEYLFNVTDPGIVKMVDEYRKLKQGVTEGAKKRAKAPVKKAPVKKAKPAEKKRADKEKMTKARAFREDASEADQMAFLRQHAAKSLGGE